MTTLAAAGRTGVLAEAAGTDGFDPGDSAVRRRPGRPLPPHRGEHLVMSVTATRPDGASAALTPGSAWCWCCCSPAQFMLAVDFSILNVALPVIGAGLGFSLAHLQWIGTAFALCAAGFTLLFGRVADLFGRRRLFLGGLVVLGAASLAGGLAQSPEVADRGPGVPGGWPPRRSPRPVCRC